MAANRVLVVGANGRMGERVRAALEAHSDLRLGAALEAADSKAVGREIEGGVVITSDVAAALAAADVAIEFSVPSATLANVAAASEAGVACIIGTTGFSADEKQQVVDFAQRIPIIHAANFSVSVNVLAWLTREAARLLGDGYDAELFEIHHSAKRDAPSGTALRLAEALAEGRSQNLDERLVLERAGDIGARPEGAIAIQTLRGGDNPGEHTVMFVGQGERLELTHRSATRDHFAQGAVRAAAWLVGRPAGLYAIDEVFGIGADVSPPR